MKLYIVQAQELIKANPPIDCFNLKSDGLYVGAPGTIIFRSRQEAEEAIVRAHIALAKEMKRQEEAANDKTTDGTDA